METVKNILGRSYFGKLFQKDRFLFVVAFLFISFSILANLIRLETSPFFVWNIYSERYYPRQDYDIIEVRYNDNKLLNIKHTWQSPQEVFLTEPLYNYLNSKKNGGQDPARDYLENHWAQKHPAFKNLLTHLYNSGEQYDAFPAWYKSYLSAVQNEPVQDIRVLKRRLRFDEAGQIAGISTDTLLMIP
jgi:hypothetical protein